MDPPASVELVTVRGVEFAIEADQIGQWSARSEGHVWVLAAPTREDLLRWLAILLKRRESR